MVEPTRFVERTSLTSVSEAIKAGRIDRKAGLIRDVKFMGLESRNGRRYNQPDPKLFEGVPLRIDHHGKEGGMDMPTDPSIKDVWATSENVTTSPMGVRGDVRYNPHHPLIESILWWAENQPNIGGFSPVTWGLHSTVNGESVIDIMKVESVDLVDRPATTNGFYEQEKTMDPKDILKLQESLLAKTSEATKLAADLTAKTAEATKLAADLEAATKRANEAEGKLATEAAAKLASERRGAREKLIADAKLPEEIVTAEFKEAVVNAADDKVAALMVERVAFALGSPKSVTSDAGSAKPVESFESAKAAGLFNYGKV